MARHMAALERATQRCSLESAAARAAEARAAAEGEALRRARDAMATVAGRGLLGPAQEVRRKSEGV